MTDQKRNTAAALVQKYYDSFNKRDIASMLACVSDDIAHDVNQGERRSGKAKFQEFCNHMDDCYQEQLENVVVMASDDGRSAAAEFIVSGIYKKAEQGLPAAHGQTYRLPAGAFLDIRDGKITRVTTYYNLQEWIKQVKAA
jgi:steroid delta-isomerase-like uncharacterized protein